MVREHSTDRRREHISERLLLIAIIMLAFAVRVHRLAGQSMWGDELWSLSHISAPDLASVFANVRADGTAPPGYYLFLHFWRQMTGESEFALRFLSVMWGTLITPVIFVLGVRLGGRRNGLIAAFIQALSPFYVYYSQEARAYIQATFFSLLASYLFLRLWEGRRTFLVWFGYIMTGLLAAGSHYFAAPVLAAHSLFWLGDYAWALLANRPQKSEKRKGALSCLSAQLIIILIFLLWFNYVQARLLGLSGSSARMAVPLATVIPRVLYDFNVGIPVLIGAQEAVRWQPLLPFGLLLLGALLDPRNRRSLVTLLLWLSIILLAIFYVSFPTWAGWSRYFIALSPYYYLLLARGADGYVFLITKFWPTQHAHLLGNSAMLFLLAIPAFFQIRALQYYYTDPRYARWDYRGYLAMLAQDTHKGSAAVYNGHAALPLPLRYYTLRNNLSWHILPTDCSPEREKAEQEISAVAAQHEKIWLVQTFPHSCDPACLIYNWLNEYGYRTHEFWLENHLFSHYLIPSEMSDYKAPAQTGTFDGLFTLEAYALNHTQIKAGEALAISLHWRSLSSMEVDYKFFLPLLSASGELVALRDGMPGNWTKPTTIWQPGDLVSDGWGMPIGNDVPEGLYTLYVGAYHPANGERLPLKTASGEHIGDMLEITNIYVVREIAEH